MFIYFSQHKLKYERGQLAPFFIFILVVLLMVALVTVNISKVALNKNSASNAVDAGALAGGSVMANVFNALAQANQEMYNASIEFMISISISFAIAFIALTVAQSSSTAALAASGVAKGMACPTPCAAIASAQAATTAATSALNAMNLFIQTIIGITLAVTAFAIAQWYFYKSIRKMVKEGREQAINIAHKFAYINAGLGSKLKEGLPNASLSSFAGIGTQLAGACLGGSGVISGLTVAEQEQFNDRKVFGTFIDKIGHNDTYCYPWIDGQTRDHFVETDVDIEPVDTFNLTIALNPLPGEIALLIFILAKAFTAQGGITVATGMYALAAVYLGVSCAGQSCCNNPWTAAVCCPIWWAFCALAIVALGAGDAGIAIAMGLMSTLFISTALALAMLAPNPIPIPNSDENVALLFIIYWIDDIDHDRLIRVDTMQHHTGADLGIWQTRYPDTLSHSLVNFTGFGRVGPPPIDDDDLRHDPSIVATD